MARDAISTLTGSPTDGTQTHVTGTDSGTKRGIDVATFSIPYATRIDEVSASVTYVGKAALAAATSGAVWQVFKMTVSGTETIITWADGNSDFDNVWDNRAGLSYS